MSLLSVLESLDQEVLRYPSFVAEKKNNLNINICADADQTATNQYQV